MSEFTTPDKKAEPQPETSWWGSIAATASSFAQDFEKSIMEQAKAAQSQMDAEAEKIRRERATMAVPETPHLGAGLLQLPWDTSDDAKSILCDPLMEKILALSIAEGNFTTTPNQPQFDVVSFDMQKSVPVIMKVLEIDKNLARMHAKLSPKMNEELFWRNYFFRVKYLRAAVGMDGPDLQCSLGSLPEHEVIHTAALPSTSIPKRVEAVSEPRAAPIERAPESVVDAKEDAAINEAIQKQEAEEARKAEAARLEAEVLAELNEDIDSSDTGLADSPLDVGAMMAGASVNEISLDDDDDDAALEAMIAKELGEDAGLLGDGDDDDDIMDGFEDDLDFS